MGDINGNGEVFRREHLAGWAGMSPCRYVTALKNRAHLLRIVRRNHLRPAAAVGSDQERMENRLRHRHASRGDLLTHAITFTELYR